MRKTIFNLVASALPVLFLASRGASQSTQPILPLNLSLKLPAAAMNPGSDSDILQNKAARQKALKEYKDALTKLGKSRDNQAANIQSLRQAASRLGPGARLFAELTAGRVKAGLTPSGGKSGKPDESYRNHLLAACNIAAKMDDKNHEDTALYAISVWRKSQNNDAPWTMPPVDSKAQKQFAFMKAIIERQALREWALNQKDSAIKKYRTLAASLSGSPDGAALDLRILELEKSIYEATKSTERYQRELATLGGKYQDQQVLGAGNESRAQKVAAVAARLHKELVNEIIAKAMPKSAGNDNRKRAIRSIDVYLGTNPGDAERERVRRAQGEIEYNHENHKAAAGIFAALATESEGNKASDYWRKSIRSQTILAGWPVEAPWNDASKGDQSARVVLLDMYKKIDSGTAQDWMTGSHIGLLMIATGQSDDAVTYWTDRLNKSARGLQASLAAGWLTSSRIEGRQWAELENLGRLLVKSGLVAQYKEKKFKPRDVLGLALIEGGSALMAANDYKPAVGKLEEFVKGWRGDIRHDEGMYKLALAYQGNQQYRDAVLELESFAKAYPKSKYRKDAMVLGGTWTLALTWDEHVLFFLETHAKEFPTDAQAKDSLATLADLYLGKQIYDSALRVMQIQISRKDLDDGTRYDVARRLLETAERHSSPDNALKTAEKLSRQFPDSPLLTASAMTLKARIFALRGNMSALRSLEKQITAIDTSQPEMSEMESEIRFLIAETFAKDKFKDEVFSLATKDPAATLEKGYELMNQISQLYKSACAQARSSWCAPALHRLARVSEAFVASYQDLQIAKTLEPEIVRKFQSRKKEILESTESIALELDEKSYELAKSGATNPAWTTAIMWQNGGEWSSEKFTSEAASHYIQWHTR